MNIQDALAWANARIVDRYRMVQADFRTFQDGSVLATYDAGTRYEQMDADALSVLATEVEAQRGRVCENCQEPRWVSQRADGWWYCDRVTDIVRSKRGYITTCRAFRKREGA